MRHYERETIRDKKNLLYLIKKMNHTLTVSAAYGRDFKNKKEILNYWNSNKDFQNLGYANSDIYFSGVYVNKKDAKRFKVGFLNVRYGNLKKIAVIDVNEDKFI